MNMTLTQLRDGFVYPGHPVTLAYAIVRWYPSLKLAESPNGDQFPHALGNNDIPGAGGNVYGALLLLSMAKRENWPRDKLHSHAAAHWSRCDDQETKYPDRWQRGQEQADKIEPLLWQALANWPIE